MSRATLLRLARDSEGATLVEFAIIAPVLVTLLLGLMDLSYNLYATSILEGAIQEAGRDATIEGAETRGLAIDNGVRERVNTVVPSASFSFDRRAYIDYDDVAKAETFTDVNDDGQCNDGEPFEDANANGAWDDDRGREEMGGARDAVLYTVTIEYPRLFPLMRLVGFDETVTSRARTVLRNQPYGPQNQAVALGSCE